LASKQKVLDQIINLLNILANKKLPNKDSSMSYKPHINEPKQMGQNIGAKFRILINLLYFTHWAPFLISSERNVTSHWQ